jgi:hypothetical protein
MISKPTVLVLGAGASTGFGLPSGDELSLLIIEGLAGGPMREHVVAAGVDAACVEVFRKAFARSGQPSVDAFLEYRREFMDVGKKAMAYALLPKESEDHLFGKESWYRYLFQRMGGRFEDLLQNRLAIITFNYDRSLEHFLYTAIENSYGRPASECANLVKSLSITHLYGDLGELPWQRENNDEPVPFGADATNVLYLKRASSRIKIVHEDVSGNDQFRRAHEWLRDAQSICFLGFGYGEVNLERIMAFGPKEGKHVFGTALGFENAALSNLSLKMQSYGFPAPLLEPTRGRVLDFLRIHCPF